MQGTGRWWWKSSWKSWGSPLSKGGCRRFVREAEEYLAGHAGPVTYTPLRLRTHLALCRACWRRWQSALASRELLVSTRAEAEPAADPLFYPRLRTRIQAAQRSRAQVRWLHLALAMALFLAALGSFAYNLRRTETPNADEAMALDVPHINPQHPVDSHVRPQLADAMENLMNP